MIGHPVHDLAHSTQVCRRRERGAALAGNEDRGGAVTPAAPSDADESPATTVPPAPPELRRPTAEAPLRVFVGGDSVVRDAGESLLRIAADDPLLAASLHYEIATGLSRPDFYDWPSALVSDSEPPDPELAIILFGVNDAHGPLGADGTGSSTGSGNPRPSR